MFDGVTRRDCVRRAARRGAYLLGSAALSAILLAALVTAGFRAPADPIVPVQLVRPLAAPRLGPPPPPPSGHAAAARRPEPIKHPAASPAPLVPPKPSPEVEKPRPLEPETLVPSSDVDDGAAARGDGNAAAGVEGGVPGGVVGGVAGPGSSPDGALEDTLVEPASAARRPRPADPNCVRNRLLVTGVLRSLAAIPVRVKFAVGRDGAPSTFEVLGSPPDGRISAAVWQAIQSCRWFPGADLRGQPARMWYALRVRFENE